MSRLGFLLAVLLLSWSSISLNSIGTAAPFILAYATESDTRIAPVSADMLHCSKNVSLRYSDVIALSLQSPVSGDVFRTTSPLRCDGKSVYCPAHSPICCGSGDNSNGYNYYCIPSGSKCCAPRDPQSGAATYCQQSEECCAGSHTTMCCQKGTTCLVTHSYLGEESVSCVPHRCAAYTTADACVASGLQCGWCCDESRCTVLRHSMAPPYITTCKNGDLPLQNMTQRCSSHCSYYNTCALCMKNSLASASRRWKPQWYADEDFESEPCSWCLSSASCIASKDALRCPATQVANFESQCDLSYFHYTDSSKTDLLLIACVGYILGVFLVIWIPYQLYHHNVFQWDEEEEPGASASTGNPQESVRRYGFAYGRGSANGTTAPPLELQCRMRCAVCEAPVVWYRAEDGAERETETPQREDHVEEGEGRAVAAAAQSPPPPESHAAPGCESFVMLLPCHHIVCDACLDDNVRYTQFWRPVRKFLCACRKWRREVVKPHIQRWWLFSKTSSPSPSPNDESPTESAAAPVSDTSSPPDTAVVVNIIQDDAAEPETQRSHLSRSLRISREVVQRGLEGRCPCCASEIADVFISDQLHAI